jgi:hypothetical protein
VVVLSVLLNICSNANQQQVRSLLEKLRQDADADVRYFAIEATEGMHFVVFKCHCFM